MANPHTHFSHTNPARQAAHAVLLCCALAASTGLADPPALPVRDPFWPIGYQPPKPAAEPTPAEKEPALAAPPEPPAVKPISEEDWAEARKSLVISGYTQSVRPDTGERISHVMINRRTYSSGDTVATTRLNTRFTWLLEAITGRDLTLKPVEATRLTPGTPQQ